MVFLCDANAQTANSSERGCNLHERVSGCRSTRTDSKTNDRLTFHSRWTYKCTIAPEILSHSVLSKTSQVAGEFCYFHDVYQNLFV